MKLTKDTAKSNIIIVENRIKNFQHMIKGMEKQITKLNEVKDLLVKYIETGDEDIKNQIKIIEEK